MATKRTRNADKRAAEHARQMRELFQACHAIAKDVTKDILSEPHDDQIYEFEVEDVAYRIAYDAYDGWRILDESDVFALAALGEFQMHLARRLMQDLLDKQDSEG